MDSFNQRKGAVLSKEDKSSKGSWDSRIVKLCEKINLMEDYYTTSSCSGKCVIIEEKTGKDGSYYLWSSHDLIEFKELKRVVSELSVPPAPPIVLGRVNREGKIIKFKMQSPVLFVVCRDFEFAENLFNLARDSGFKESGIHSTKKLIGVEIRSGEKIECPIFDKGKVLCSDDFLKVLVSESNRKLVLGWDKIQRFLDEISKNILI